jgi:CheY-like chemotaxis protein
LKRRGYTVLTALSGEEGLNLAATEKPDAILMDVKMPVMDGFEATRRLKSNPLTTAIPVIALTAHAMLEDREQALACGANEYETKPVDLDLLLSKITALIAARPS